MRVTIPEKICSESSSFIGTSRGKVAQARMDPEDLTVHITNMFNPNGAKVIAKSYLATSTWRYPSVTIVPITLWVVGLTASLCPHLLTSNIKTRSRWPLSMETLEKTSLSAKLSNGSKWMHLHSLPQQFPASGVIYSDKDSTFYLIPNTPRLSSSGGKKFPKFPLLSRYNQLVPLSVRISDDVDKQLCMLRCFVHIYI